MKKWQCKLKTDTTHTIPYWASSVFFVIALINVYSVSIFHFVFNSFKGFWYLCEKNINNYIIKGTKSNLPLRHYLNHHEGHHPRHNPTDHRDPSYCVSFETASPKRYSFKSINKLNKCVVWTRKKKKCKEVAQRRKWHKRFALKIDILIRRFFSSCNRNGNRMVFPLRSPASSLFVFNGLLIIPECFCWRC